MVSTSHLIAITDKEEVASIKGKPTYRITDVALIPLTTKAEAQQAIRNAAKRHSNPHPRSNEEDRGSELSGDEIETSILPIDNRKDIAEGAVNSLEPPKAASLPERATTMFQDVLQDAGSFGRLAGQWFGKGKRDGLGADTGLAVEHKRQAKEALLPAEEEGVPTTARQGADQKPGEKTSKPQHTRPTAIESYAPRILQSTRVYFSSAGFYFSYDEDISSRLALQDPAQSPLPLWMTFMDVYFWNRYLIDPFVQARQEHFILPLLQGFVGQRVFSIARTTGDEQGIVIEAARNQSDLSEKINEGEKAGEEFLLTLISRRSTKRAGLRYLRRGIDDEGNVANNVETEQLLASQKSGTTQSLVQIRGSIPLFFSQTPYSFKPLPMRFGTETANQNAFKKHFYKLSDQYGPVQAVSLVDRHGTEVSIGEAYELHYEKFNTGKAPQTEPLSFTWFDFHSACKGMKFENISLLVDQLQPTLTTNSWTTQIKPDTAPTTLQTGIIRTNCMDCLDRSNVAQSALAARILKHQLAFLNLHIDLQTDPKTHFFNALWADNGDAISKQYAGTAALKGDFTRTRKRHWFGAVTDAGLTLTRYWNGVFGDYFLQTCVDFWLGKGGGGGGVWEAFELDLGGRDYAVDVARVRRGAVGVCFGVVFEGGCEDFVGGWVFTAPPRIAAGVAGPLPFEEGIVLLTESCFVFCRFDWEREVVVGWERVELRDVRRLWRGAYITGVLGPSQMDPETNVGFAIEYEAPEGSVVHAKIREDDITPGRAGGSSGGFHQEKLEQGKRVLAFKALPPSAGSVDTSPKTSMKEAELTEHVCKEIHICWTEAMCQIRGPDHLGMEAAPIVEEKDVVSLEEAKKNAGLVESLGHSLKKFVWS